MRLVDFFIDPILKLRELLPALDHSEQEHEPVKKLFVDMLIQAQSAGIKAGFDKETMESALFPVVAYIDESLMTSKWSQRLVWQKSSLQREFYQTTNAGRAFYDRLNKLNRQGNDRSVREVYLLCLGLGFKGQYYSPQDRPKIEEIRVFNLDLLLPQDANKKFEKSTLFADAYAEGQQGNGGKRSRINLTPFIVAIPIVTVTVVLGIYATNIGSGISSIMDLVK